ncbi:MAG TPA: ABC transporter ATP-binding protein [Gaiellaceae bacterium]|nr:ABC transporter ATP-binding protein [Gaiellaceae bacterium]
MPASVSFDRAGAALLVERLTKVYADGTRAIDELELRIPGGCFFGLLGPNGAGKTTLIGAVSGLVRAARGRIFVFGHDAVADSAARLLVGVAPQDVHLDRFLTAREVLAYHGRYFGLPKLEATQRADELLEVFDLAAKANTKPHRLSGGMRRRLLIARALVHRPRLLILDEPTAGVDLELRHELWRYLRRLHGEEQLTVLLTTHYLEEAEALCERIAFIRAGQIAAEGAPAELTRRFGGDRLEEAYVEAMRR